MVNVTTTYFPSYLCKSTWSVFLNMRHNSPFQDQNKAPTENKRHWSFPQYH